MQSFKRSRLPHMRETGVMVLQTKMIKNKKASH